MNGDYEYALKWKIHDTSSRLGSSEDTFTQVYVYDLKEIHHYNNRNTFWIDKRQQKNRISHYVKPPYDSFNDDYECRLKWKIHDTLSRLGSSENTFTQVYVYEPETIKLNTDHYFIEQYNRQRAPQKKISRCLLASWNLDQNLGRIRNRRRHCS